MFERDVDGPVSVRLFLDEANEPFAMYLPPVKVALDTTRLNDGPHILRIEAAKANGAVGRRTIRFVVANGPGISVTGLRDGKTIAGDVEFDVNAFEGGTAPFDVTSAESRNPIPVWVWVLIATITVWAGWYGIEQFRVPAAFATTPTYAAGTESVAALAPATSAVAPAASGKSLAEFDYGKTGENAYAANCAACHGVSGAGLPGAFPALAGDAVVLDPNPAKHIAVVLHGLHGVPIGATSYAAQMPSFARLDDATIAAIIDRERTSWGNAAPTIVPGDVRRARNVTK